MGTDNTIPCRTFGDLSRPQLAIYAKELQEHYQQEISLRRKLEENNRDLEQRVREVAALNQLFQEHLRQRSQIVEAYSEVVEGLRKLNQETSALTERAKGERLPESGVSPGLNAEETVTILFSDIEGFTSMTERLGDYLAQEVLRAHNAIVRRRVEVSGGFEVKSMGDGFMVAFPSPLNAVQCAVDIQRAFAAYNSAHPNESLHVRIGLHTGEFFKEVVDFSGKNVILASRIAGHAQGGQILVSSLLKELMEDAGDIDFGEALATELKGLTGTNWVYPVLWDSLDIGGPG